MQPRPDLCCLGGSQSQSCAPLLASTAYASRKHLGETGRGTHVWLRQGWPWNVEAGLPESVAWAGHCNHGVLISEVGF